MSDPVGVGGTSVKQWHHVKVAAMQVILRGVRGEPLPGDAVIALRNDQRLDAELLRVSWVEGDTHHSVDVDASGFYVVE